MPKYHANDNANVNANDDGNAYENDKAMKFLHMFGIDIVKSFGDTAETVDLTLDPKVIVKVQIESEAHVEQLFIRSCESWFLFDVNRPSTFRYITGQSLGHFGDLGG